MCIQAQFIQDNEKSILTMAFQAEVRSFAEAEVLLAEKAPGTFLTFSVSGQNFCSAVGKNGEMRHNPFRWDVSGGWYNGSPALYATELDLLDHLVAGQHPTPLYR